MGKKGRIALYLLSVVILIGMAALIILSHDRRMEKADHTISDGGIETSEEPINGSDAEDISGKLDEEKDALPDATEHEDTTVHEDTTEETDSKSTTLIFAGDVLFANSFKNNYDAAGIEKVIEPQLLKELNAADIFMVNNEFPYSLRGEAMADKQFTFRCDPKYVTALNEMGVDIVSLANNHTLDFGTDALSDTFKTLDQAGILYAGAGDTKERAYELEVIERNGKKFGFLAASRVIPVSNWNIQEWAPGMLTAYDDTKLVELIKNARESCDFLTVYLHWGVEYDAYPQAYQVKIAEDCFTSGADLVIGAHTHCLQGVSYIDGKPVFFSLGNFVFGSDIDKSMAVKVIVDSANQAEYQLIPVYASSGTTKKMDGKNAASVCEYIEKISSGIKVDESGHLTEK